MLNDTVAQEKRNVNLDLMFFHNLSCKLLFESKWCSFTSDKTRKHCVFILMLDFSVIMR